MVKICRSCKKEKDIEMFGRSKKYKCGRVARCKECMSGEIHKAHAVYAKKHPERSYRKTHNKEFRKYIADSIKPRYGRYKQSAKHRGLDFSIALDEFGLITSKPCCYCGKYSANKDYCGIDRVDNNKGYVLDNCVACCAFCNWMKSSLSIVEFIAHIKQICKHYIDPADKNKMLNNQM